MVGGGRPLLREILGQPTPIGTKSPSKIGQSQDAYEMYVLFTDWPRTTENL